MDPKKFDLEDMSALLTCTVDNLLVLHNALEDRCGNDPAYEGLYSVWAQLHWIAGEMNDQISKLPPEAISAAAPK